MDIAELLSKYRHQNNFRAVRHPPALNFVGCVALRMSL